MEGNVKVLILGSTGGIGSELHHLLAEDGHNIVTVQRSAIKNIQLVLANENPDWVFNCIGKLGNNMSKFKDIFIPNVQSNWDIIQFYLNNLDANVSIVILGSSAYSGGRKDYILYSSSKAALHNMWEGARENFNGTSIRLGIVHPSGVNTKMRPTGAGNQILLAPNRVAKTMISLIKSMSSSTIVNLRA
jgi:short-subunit dehydrogenase